MYTIYHTHPSILLHHSLCASIQISHMTYNLPAFERIMCNLLKRTFRWHLGMPSSSMLQVAYSKDRNMQLSTLRTSSYPGPELLFFSTRFTDSKKNPSTDGSEFPAGFNPTGKRRCPRRPSIFAKIRISQLRFEEGKFPSFFLFFPSFPITFEKDTKWLLSIHF